MGAAAASYRVIWFPLTRTHVPLLGNLVIKDKFIRRWARKEGFSGFSGTYRG